MDELRESFAKFLNDLFEDEFELLVGDLLQGGAAHVDHHPDLVNIHLKV